MIMEKKCSSCKVTMALGLFGAKKIALDGHQGRCKPCVSIQNKKYQAKNKVAINKQRTNYRNRNKVKVYKVDQVKIIKEINKVNDKIEKERIKAIMSVPIKQEATHYYYMPKSPMQKEQEIGV